MLRRLTSLLVTSCLVPAVLGASLLPPAAAAQAPAPERAAARGEARARAPAPAPPARAPAAPRKPEPAESAEPAAPPPAPAPVQTVEYTFLRREDPEADLAQLQQLGAEGWQVVATVEVDGSTRRYVLMRPKR
jgi:hypothetical protein